MPKRPIVNLAAAPEGTVDPYAQSVAQTGRADAAYLAFASAPAAQTAATRGVPDAGTAIVLTSADVTIGEDFNSLANTGTSSTVPSGWAFAETGTNANLTYTAGTGSATAGDTYSFGSAGSADRAFGTIQSGSLISTIGATFVNNTGAAITSLDISYVGEQWRLGATGRADRLDFQYSLDATSLTTGTWVDVDQLDFNSPVTTGSVGALDGNAAANRTLIGLTLPGLNVAAGSSIWIRWVDFNATGSDDGLGIDDFSLTAHNGAATPTIQFQSATLSQAEGSGGGMTNFSFVVTRSSSTGAASIGYTIAGSGANPADASDFVGGAAALTGTVTFADGASTATIVVPVSADTTLENDETFTVMLGAAPAGYALGTQSSAIGTITNDDGNVIPAGSFASAYTAAAAGTYTLLAGTTRAQTAGVGVSVTSTAGPVDIDIQGTLNDTASGQRAINFANNPITGSLTVGAAGLVQSLNGDAVRVQSVSGTINVTNLGQILMTSAAFTPSVGGTNPGSAYAITYNAALGAAGAPATDYASGGTITNGSSTNGTALIRSDNGDAIRLGSHTTLVNYGTINGNGQVNDSSSNNSYNASGNTSVAETYDISRGVRINQAGATAVQVQNYGTITGAQHGLDTGVADATNIVVTNNSGGSIIGRNGSGVGSDTAGTAATTYTVNNYGLIRGDYAPLYDRAGYVATDGDGDGVDIDGGATITNFAGGQIIAMGAGGFDSNGRANQSEGISIGGGSIANSGTITGANAGIVVNNDSNANGSRSGVGATTLVNYAGATITGQTSFAIRLENKAGTAIDNDAITNYGAITGNGSVPAGTVVLQNGAVDAGTIGTLDGVTYTAADAGSARFIRGDGAAIQMGEGDDTLANYGTITGNSGRAVNLEGGSDTLTLYTGSAVSGRLDGGAGSDTLVLRLDDRPVGGVGPAGGNSGATTGTIGGVVNFEALGVRSGTWSITDAQTYASGVTIDAGATLVLADGTALAAAITVNGALRTEAAGTLTLADAIGGSGTLTKAGAGRLTLASSASSYAGGTALTAGTLDVTVAGAAGTGAITFGAGAQTLIVENAALSAGMFVNQIGGFANDGDTIDVRGIGTATASYNAGTGDLTLAGTGTAVLHIGTGYGAYLFQTAADGVDGTSVQVVLPSVNQAPIFAPAPGASPPPTYLENAPAVQVIDAVTVDDPDSASYAGGSLTAAITGGSAAGDLLLLAGTGIALDGSLVRYNGTAVGTLTASGGTTIAIALNGAADDAAVRAIAQAVRFASISDNPGAAGRTVTFTLVDGGGTASGGHDTASFARTVGVTPVNDAPSGADAAFTLGVGTVKTFAVADFGFSDVDGNALLAVKIAALPANGALYYDADGPGGNAPVAVTAGQAVSAADIAAGRLFYVAANAGGGASFTFQVQDDGGTANGGVDTDPSPNTIALTVTAPPATVHVFDTDFAQFTAAGFAPGAAAPTGQLDSNMWRVVGLSDIARPAYGFTGPAGGDFGRGIINGSADPTSAGVYSPSADHALVLQPTGAELDANGYVEARFQNTTGATITNFDVAFDWAYRNSAARADNLELQYSTDGSNFTAVRATDFSTPTTAASPIPSTFTNQHEAVTIDGVVASGGYLYLRWVHLSSSGGGNRDEVGIDNVSIDAHTSTAPTASVTGGSVLEGNGGTTQAVFTISRSSAAGTATVDYATQDGTALAGSDYVAASGTVTFAPGELTRTVTVSILGDTRNEADESFSLRLSNASGFAVPQPTATMTIQNDDTGPVAIYDIQGAGHRSLFTGQIVSTGGIVTSITSTGFYLQDATGDGDIATSDGIFVFTSSAPTGVAVGNQITLSGTVAEFASATNQLSVTELTSPTAITVVNTSVALPAAVIISTDGSGRAPPTTVIDDDGLTSFNPTTDGADFYESLEGMRVTIRNPLVVASTNANGETFVVASNGVGATGLNSRSGMTISPGDFNPETLKIFQGSTAAGAHSQGDVLNDVTGIVNYFGGRYEVDPTAAVTKAVDNPVLARETSTLRGDAGHLSYASFNVENLGPVAKAPVTQAEVDARYAAHAYEVVNALNSPDIIGLQEIQDANGENAGGDLSGQASAQKLIDAIAAAGGPIYAYVEIAPAANNSTGGVAEGNIRNGFLYNTARTSYVDGSAKLLTDAAYNGSRQPLVADFRFNGQLFTAIDVHSISRGGSDPLYSSNQPPVNAGDASRTAQAQGIANFVAATLAADPAHNFVVNGDFNGFYFETALQLLGPESGGALRSLYYKLPVEERYSYFFDGYYQTLDHIIVSSGLYADTGFDVVHYNAGYDASQQATDHDQPLATIGLARADGAATAVADSFATTAAAMYFGTVLANDTGGGAGLVVAALNGDAAALNHYVRLASGAELLLYANGSFAYDPDGAFSGLAAGATATDQFSYTLSGGATANVTVTVRAVPTPAPDAAGHINGTAGSDVYGGTQGADYFDLSQGGNDTVNGGAGNDAFFLGAAFTAYDRVSGGSGIDQIVLQGSYTGTAALGLAANTLANVEIVSVLAGSSYTIVTADGNVAAGQGLTIDGNLLGAADKLVFNGAAETDGSFQAYGGLAQDQLTGGAGDDVLAGRQGDDIVVGNGGNDILFGGQDNDILLGGAGNDQMNGNLGNDQVNGGDGNDVIQGNEGNDVLQGNAGNDVIYGGKDDDTIYGGQGDDQLFGNLGNDLLQGGIGLDTMSGGGGADTFRFATAADSPLATPDLITDFETAIDKIDLTAIRTGAADSFTISSGGGSTFVDVDLGGNGSIDLRIQATGTNVIAVSDILWTGSSGAVVDDGAALARGHAGDHPAWSMPGHFDVDYALF